ncbi:type II toxin-antitoxin system toxin DNA ADP-ribosyl transferase DarT [Elioraea sp.]|uniref:type II toxin-antitoxin system toxin DNA ADP-ribosyl transferase DarT n=1 Tax=Elioraea sp. TaxID=2185103 RepID=UPI003F72B7A0
MPPPTTPKIYHILHVDRLASVLAAGCLFSDVLMSGRQGAGTTIGMNTIKARRLQLPVTCRPGTFVGEYVPFYFCPRSIMLYVIWKANHPELAYRGGQEAIITLEADLRQTVTYADATGQPWAISLSNAGAYYATFQSDLAALDDIDWAAVLARDFRRAEVKEAKQAEFLIHGSFPWTLVERIGVQNGAVQQEVAKRLACAAHRPPVHVKKDWYYP